MTGWLYIIPLNKKCVSDLTVQGESLLTPQTLRACWAWGREDMCYSLWLNWKNRQISSKNLPSSHAFKCISFWSLWPHN